MKKMVPQVFWFEATRAKDQNHHCELGLQVNQQLVVTEAAIQQILTTYL